MIVFIYLSLHMYEPCVWGLHCRSQEGQCGTLGPSGAGVTGSCELPAVGTRNQTWFLFKNSMFSYLLSHLSSSCF